MKNVTNAINTMLHVHKASNVPMNGEKVSSWQEHMPVAEEEQALSVIEHCVRTFGADALQELEERVELLQEEFLAHVCARLQEKNIRLDERLTLSLSHDNMLVLQCQEHEEALLAVLGEDALLRQRLQNLRAAAFLAQGLQYFSAAKAEKPVSHLGEYHICLKGKLSHFYLK